MQHFTNTRAYLVIASFVFLLLGAAPLSALPDEKMNPKDLIAKHLEAIGTAQARSAITSRLTLGTCKVYMKGGGTNGGDGRVVLASEGVKNLIGLVFGYTEYPHEKFGYDGKEVSISYLKPGQRSSWGTFILTNNQIFAQGLFGGALSSAWPLFDPEVRQAKLEFGGTKKIEGKEAYILRYFPQKGADVKIAMFFDKESFRHIRTEYTRVIESRMGGVAPTATDRVGDQRGTASSQQLETRYTLFEDFKDFKDESGLMLPHSYKIELWIDGPAGSARNRWELTLTQFGFNQKFDEGAFDVNKANG
jgi:hypothetical protein